MKSPVLPVEHHFGGLESETDHVNIDVRDSVSNTSPSEHAETNVQCQVSRHTTSQPGKRYNYALVAYGDDYVQPLILSALQGMLPAGSVRFLDPPTDTSPLDVIPLAVLLSSVQADDETRILQIAPYERIDFAHALSHPHTCLVNSYAIRKALIRKHFLSATVDQWCCKHPESVLRTHVKRSEVFEVDYAEFLDDALVEAFDLRASLERNKAFRESGEQAFLQQEYWILKPGMSDGGHGIRLFADIEELQAIFEAWDAELSDSQDDDDDDDDCAVAAAAAADDGGGGHDTDHITTSHLRHFVAQPYIDPPMLIDKRKFHVRVYVLALGRLRIYVFRDMLALFAASPYRSPSDVSSAQQLDAHLTNTCLQSSPGCVPAEDAVRRFWDLTLPGPPGRADAIFTQICAVTGELFEAALGNVVNFQPLQQAFEVFGLDFLIDAQGTAWLLEVNAFPDFRQTGPVCRDVVSRFWDSSLRLAVLPFLHAEASVDGDDPAKRRASSSCDPELGGMVLVKELNLGIR